MKKFKAVKRLPAFDKDLKKLLKRFPSLEDDLNAFITTQLDLFHTLRIDNGGIVEITGLGLESPKIYKARKFACKSLKGRGVQSGIRVIYAYTLDSNSVELIEIYFKADQENEDKQRIIAQYKNA